MLDKYDLSGKTVLVTGGSQGIGRAIVYALAKANANIIINFRSNQELAEETAIKVREITDNKIWLWQFDLARENVLSSLKTFIAKHSIPPIDILVTNASLQIRKPWNEVTNEDIAQQMNVNFRSTLLLIQAVVPHMKKQKWGRILNIGSVQEKRPHPDMCVYAASKSALSNLVIDLAPQLAPSGITINSLAPGVIGTARNEIALSNAEYFKKIIQKIPLGYIGESDDCAQVALLLCSDAGRYITGCNYFVDGGMSLLF